MPDMIHGRQTVALLTNKSGGGVIAGDVVILDTSNDSAFTTTTSARSEVTVGIAQQTIANNASGRVLFQGYAPLVNVSASVTRGHYLETHTVAKQATANSARRSGTFGQLLTGGTTPAAVIWVGPDQTAVASGSIASDTLWAAKGDLALGTANDTAAILTAGSNGTVPTYQSGQSTGVLPQYPPGYEIDYVERTTDFTTTGTNDAGATAIITGTSLSFDGTAIMIHVFSGELFAAASDTLILSLWDGSTEIGRIGSFFSGAASDNRVPFTGLRRYTPSAGTHQFIWKGHMGSGQSTSVDAGAGTTTTNPPAFMRITKV